MTARFRLSDNIYTDCWYLREIQISNVNTVATLTIFVLSQFHVYLYKLLYAL